MPKNLKILIVEDDPSCFVFLKTFFQRHYPDFSVEGAFEGFMACLKAQGKQPDLILLDIKLPGVDGYRVFQFLQKMPHQYAPRVIAMSGFANDQTHQRMRELGIEHFLRKPFPLEALKEKINALFGECLEGEGGAAA